jgi:hypothetical protein
MSDKNTKPGRGKQPPAPKTAAKKVAAPLVKTATADVGTGNPDNVTTDQDNHDVTNDQDNQEVTTGGDGGVSS